MADGLEKTTIAWHPAFCSAAEFDLRRDKDNLIFDPEHNLSKEPLRMDLLIIKKITDKVSDNDIAKIFRKYNVIEYKSPDDSLTIDDLYKTIGYACLYKGTAQYVNEIPSVELTVSIFREAYPKKMMKALSDEGISITSTAPGIYTLENMKPFPTQIVVIKELDPEKHSGLRILSRHAQEDDLETFIRQAETEVSQGEKLNIDAILEVSIAANYQIFNDYKRRNPIMSEALRLFMQDIIDEECQKAAEKARKEATEAARKEAAEAARKAAAEAAEKARMKAATQAIQYQTRIAELEAQLAALKA